MKFIVQKFGGTSLATQDLREQAVARVLSVCEQYRPVVVVSAMGRLKDPFATDTLIDFAQHINRDMDSREMDMLMMCGEIISGVTLVGTFQKLGHPAIFLTGAQAGIITDACYNNARILKVNPENIVRYAKEGKIVVVAGFQGMTEDGEVTTLGRGGSDTTAAALGVALDAAYVDIYTDVEGIMTADPNIVENARIKEIVAYDEICQLAHEGAKVVHPRAVEIVMQKNIPMRIRSVWGLGVGTLVTNTSEIEKETIDITRDRMITGITQIPELAQIHIHIQESTDVLAMKQRLFQVLAEAGISLDFINIYPEKVVFTIKQQQAEQVIKMIETIGLGEISCLSDCAKVAAVGAGMTGVPGVMATIVDALAQEKIEILQANDSYTTIWLLVKMEHMEKAVRALHQCFHLAS